MTSLRRLAKRSGKISAAMLLMRALGVDEALAPEAHASSEKMLAAIPSGGAVPAPEGARGLCVRYAWVCTPSHSGARAQAEGWEALQLARQVNSYVNRTTREISDRRQYGREEVWALPTRRGGDCEDFALLKMKHLIEHGVAPEDLRIATVLDENLDNHAVLVISLPMGDFVLDNRRQKVMPWQSTGYYFLRAMEGGSGGQWVAALSR